jgi:acetoin utilization deacetylase AcuC-like enzyme
MFWPLNAIFLWLFWQYGLHQRKIFLRGKDFVLMGYVMPKIRFISNQLAKHHSNGRFHPESPQRIEILEQWLESHPDDRISYEIWDEQASEAEITSVHATAHYRLVERTQSTMGFFHFDGDTAANQYSFEAARQAVDVGKKSVWESDLDTSVFCLTRPPGHHATRGAAQGFCLFNNIAIATHLAIQEKKYHRIAILDVDHHFGNGTAYIHEENPNILYASVHASPRIAYPGTGFVDEIGEGDGRGFNICVPLDFRASEVDFGLAFDQLLNPIVRQFDPDFLAISIGFDAFEKDPIGVLGVTAEGFGLIGAYLQQLASELKIPCAHFLEGGYNIQMLPALLQSYISPFIDPEKSPPKSAKPLTPKLQTSTTLERLKTLFGEYWEL